MVGKINMMADPKSLMDNISIEREMLDLHYIILVNGSVICLLSVLKCAAFLAGIR
jgi:hypothetical protein